MALRKNLVLYHCSEESREENLPSESEWYEQTFPKLIELTHLLKNVDSVDGRHIIIDDHSIVIDDSLQQSMHTFKSLARAFLGSPTVQQALATQTAIPPLCFINHVKEAKFLDAAVTYDPNSTSWMRLSPSKVSGSPVSHKWEDILEMFNDLINCLRKEKEKLFHFPKLEMLKWIYENSGKGRFCLCLGKFFTSGEEKTVQKGVKQLDRALGLFKYVWETAGMKGDLELQGHLWCVGAKETTVTHRGNRFFIHGIRF
ncbi:hypothetical protein RHMOL_Rhmol02G0247900 [Rhododendron molle]|uniref:Uncharacterized protein n=1 Tax=Rhododendron molle TaxID=49168 RepID=A0ACC0PU85_RHOML|nr:hypothetical protein RHMOL_Rhmol02G0247900 [Rhododendron molle]